VAALAAAGPAAAARVVLDSRQGKENSVSSGKTVGVILMVIGLIILAVIVAWGLANLGEQLRTSGFALVVAVGVIIGLPFLGVGAYMFMRGRSEEVEMAEVKKQKRILNMVATQGQISIPEAAIELDVNRDQIRTWVYDLVGKGLFSGYINWDEGLLISRKAAELRGNKCPNCGGELELSGKGVVRCPYCGTEIFLS
jgi:DNA-directed RNA polymerase subunit RPC12/RpoP